MAEMLLVAGIVGLWSAVPTLLDHALTAYRLALLREYYVEKQLYWLALRRGDGDLARARERRMAELEIQLYRRPPFPLSFVPQ